MRNLVYFNFNEEVNLSKLRLSKNAKNLIKLQRAYRGCLGTRRR